MEISEGYGFVPTASGGNLSATDLFGKLCR